MSDGIIRWISSRDNIIPMITLEMILESVIGTVGRVYDEGNQETYGKRRKTLFYVTVDHN